MIISSHTDQEHRPYKKNLQDILKNKEQLR